MGAIPDGRSASRNTHRDTSAMWNMPPPDSGDDHRVDVDRQISSQMGIQCRQRPATPLHSDPMQ